MSFGNGCNIDYLALAKEIPKPQESQSRNLNEVGCSYEGMHMTVHDSLVKEFQLLDPPEFTGSSDIAVAEEWFIDIEKKLGLMSATDEQRVTLATAMLKGEASHWWDINKYTMITEGMTWREFVDSFLERYYPFSDRNMKKVELMRLVRKEFGDRVVKKTEKRKAGNSDQNPQQKKQRNWPLANLYSEPIVTTEEKVCFACKEIGHVVKYCPWSMQDHKTKFSTPGSNPDPSRSSTLNPDPSSTLNSNPNPNPSPTLNPKQEPQPLPLPTPQQQHQHPFSQPPLLINSQEAQQTIYAGRCYNCRQKGHLANDCPLRNLNPNPNPNSNPNPTLNCNSSRSHSPTSSPNRKQEALPQPLPPPQQQHQHPFSHPTLLINSQEAQLTIIAGICYYCRQKGHLVNDCPLRQQQLTPRQLRQQRRVQKYQKKQKSLQLKQQHQQKNTWKYQQPEVAHVEVNMEEFWESEMKRKMGKTKLSPSWQKHEQQHHHPYIVPQPALAVKGQVLCFQCKQPGHYARDCLLSPQQQVHVQPM